MAPKKTKPWKASSACKARLKEDVPRLSVRDVLRFSLQYRLYPRCAAMLSHSLLHSIACLCFVSIPLSSLGSQELADDAQLAKDTRTVETLLRLKSIDPNTNPKLSSAVSRYLKTVEGTDRYVEVVEQLKFKAAAEGIFELALGQDATPLGIQATRVLLKLDGPSRFLDMLKTGTTDERVSVVNLFGSVGNRLSCKTLSEIIMSEDSELVVRQAAVAALLKSPPGKEVIAKAFEAENFPESLRITTAAAVTQISDSAFKNRVAKYLKLPETADSQPLPPLAELMTTRGNPTVGKKMFLEKGTCSKCHVVGTEGKEVGPNLSEIGSKLSREAMYVSILDPSAAVSHNFETYYAELFDGEVVTGILTSESPDEVTIKTADAVVRKLPRDDIDLIEKQKLSLMPEGLQKNMTADELISLVEYLLTLKKKPE